MSFPETINLTLKQVFTPTATKKYPLGTRGALVDGRIFRYAKAGATALVAGNACVSEVWTELNCLNTSHLAQFAAGTTFTDTWGGVLPIAGSWDATSGGLTADAFADGWLLVGSTYGAGTIQQLRIKSHSAYGGGTSHLATGDSALKVTLETGQLLAWNITSSAGAAVVKNPYDDLVVPTATAALTGPYMGVCPVAVAANYYFWIQTWGDCACRIPDASTSTTVVGARMIQAITAATTGVVSMGSSNYAVNGQEALGVLVSPATAGGYGIVKLFISP
jgi:hypothetical protein